MRIHFSALLILATIPLSAQQPPTSGASITGTIICADTSAPGRYARVMLRPATIDPQVTDAYVQRIQTPPAPRAGTTNRAPTAPRQQSPAQQQAMRTMATRQLSMQSEQSNSTSADVNGHYILTGVSPGLYYIHVEMPGYVDPLDQFTFDQAISDDMDVRKNIAQFVPVVLVTGTEQQRVDLRIERGASITGRVLYDDGSPAEGWTINVVPKSTLTLKPGQAQPQMPHMSVGINGPPPRTDDLGYFRISGLAAGDYAVRAMLSSPAPGGRGTGAYSLNLTVYSGDTLHMADAKTFTLAPGQLHSGVDMTVPLRSLHNIHGHALAQADGHAINGGQVSAISTEDPNLHSFATLNPDGTFQLYSLPAGQYTLNLNNASDLTFTVVNPPNSNSLLEITGALGIPPRTSSRPSHRYGSVRTTVTLADTDSDDIALSVPELATPSSQQPTSQQ